MLNMNFFERVRLDTAAMEWTASPMPGVWRKPLAREEAERGHATSVVRYDPGSAFHAHNHPGGEEILVLEGVFSDATGDFRAGTYFRNPAGFAHAPFSRQGCIILVKLHQFQPGDEARVCIDTSQGGWQAQGGGVERLELHEYGEEKVSMLRLPAGAPCPARGHAGGEESFVLEGLLEDEDGRYPAGTWLRLPPGAKHAPRAIEDSVVWVKTGHLRA